MTISSPVGWCSRAGASAEHATRVTATGELDIATAPELDRAQSSATGRGCVLGRGI